jgi:HD-GYP domain-containing protein (c-di-GMP phosphodiesterase class II)
MLEKPFGYTHMLAGQGLERVSSKGLELRLLAAGDGTEIIHHRLAQGAHWGLAAMEGWKALESIFILSGRLRWISPNEKRTLLPGDTLSAQPVLLDTVFIAETDVEFLYISSQPVFHYYSNQVKELMGLAVEIEQKDGYTADHCQRIMKLSMTVGEAIGLSSTELLDLNFGSFLHDVGKISVPDYILGKPDKLTKEEWDIMKLHTVYGKMKLHETGLPTFHMAGFIVEQHHERFDGTGYPKGLKGKDISISSAIVAVVDTYDAITSDRVYRKGAPKEDALTELERNKHHYHPDILDMFFRLSDTLD